MEASGGLSEKIVTELSERECEEIVRKATTRKNVTLLKSQIESFGNFLGFLGEYFRLKIDASVDGEKKSFQFFMKSLPTGNLKQRSMLIESGIFLKEVKLYERLIPELSRFTAGLRWCPKAYLCRNDLLVLEDLSIHVYKVLPSSVKFTRAHLEVTLKSLASFHCSSIVYEDENFKLGKKSILEEFGEHLFETSVADIPWFHAGLQVILCIIKLRVVTSLSEASIAESFLKLSCNILLLFFLYSFRQCSRSHCRRRSMENRITSC